MKKAWIIGLLMLGMVGGVRAQESLVGMDKETVRVVMKAEMKEFRIDKSIVRQQFNYLKYVNNIHTKTMVIFFSEDDVCTSTKLICDYAEYDDMLDELNDRCKRTSQATWEYQSADSTLYQIALEELEWYFVLRETKKE